MPLYTRLLLLHSLLLLGLAFQKHLRKAGDQIPLEFIKMYVRCKSVIYLGSTDTPAIKYGILNTVLPSYYASRSKRAQNTLQAQHTLSYLQRHIWTGKAAVIQHRPHRFCADLPQSHGSGCHHDRVPVTQLLSYQLCSPPLKKSTTFQQERVSMRHHTQPSFSTHLFTRHKVSSMYSHHRRSGLASYGQEE